MTIGKYRTDGHVNDGTSYFDTLTLCCIMLCPPDSVYILA